MSVAVESGDSFGPGPGAPGSVARVFPAIPNSAEPHDLVASFVPAQTFENPGLASVGLAGNAADLVGPTDHPAMDVGPCGARSAHRTIDPNAAP